MGPLAAKLTVSAVCLIFLWVANFRLSVRARQLVWLALSYTFYVLWGGWFVALLVVSSLVNYAVGEFLRQRPGVGRLWVGIGFNLVLLSTFKYLPAVAALSSPGSPLSRFQHLLLPLGVSFWSFQALSYLFDIYREKDVHPTLLEFCLYMAFWPTVVSGPICRAGSLIPQFRESLSRHWSDLSAGSQRLCTGLLMIGASQVLAAGIAGQGVNAGFARSDAQWAGVDVWLLTIGYGFELFFNFAGYSHLVVGVARIFGFELPENFDRPFLATTPTMFWSRWHMSLSLWIRDYVFMPLASRRGELWWRNLTLLFAMILFGLWHGATLLLVAWGAYHGVLLVLHRIWQQVRFRVGLRPSPVLSLLSWCYTFLAVSLGWVLFRAQDWHQARAMLHAVLAWRTYSISSLPPACRFVILFSAASYFAILGVGRILEHAPSSRFGASLRPLFELLAKERWVWVSPVAVVLGLYAFLLVGDAGAPAPLLYRLF